MNEVMSVFITVSVKSIAALCFSKYCINIDSGVEVANCKATLGGHG